PLNIKWFPIIPTFGAITCFAMLLNYWRSENWVIVPINLILMVIGLIFYFIFNRLRKNKQKKNR
ncbi:MAG: hypothetical protein ACTSWR_05915, partial [Candidatus Helarchaeota archaeon]